MKSFTSWMRRQARVLHSWVDRSWYSAVLLVLAASDNFLLVVPTDGILVSSTILAPRKWWRFALAIGLGSTLGAVLLAAAIELYGIGLLDSVFPDLDQSQTYQITQKFFIQYGLFVVFLVAISPFFQQPAVILAALANTPLLELGVVIFVGRILKFLLIAYIGSHAPRLLSKLWGVQGELEQVGVQVSDSSAKNS